MTYLALRKSWALDAWSGAWTLDDGTLSLWTPERLDSGRLDVWTLDFWTQKILSIFKAISIHFLLFKHFEPLRLMHYGSVERTANNHYNSNLLQLMLKFKFSSKTTNRS